MVIEDLIPLIDANYRTISDRRGRWVEGMSMGGNGSLKFALKFPDLFSSVVAYAGPFCCAPERDGLTVTFTRWAAGPADAALHPEETG